MITGANFVADGRLVTITAIQAMNGMRRPVQTTKHVLLTVPSTVPITVAHMALPLAVTL
jgi:hypothetical protein